MLELILAQAGGGISIDWGTIMATAGVGVLVWSAQDLIKSVRALAKELHSIGADLRVDRAAREALAEAQAEHAKTLKEYNGRLNELEARADRFDLRHGGT